MALQTSMDAIESLPIFASARKTDPATSHAAAKRASLFEGEHHARILAALQHGPGGQTEIARRTGLTLQQVSRRLKKLRESGLIERTGREVEGGESEYRVSAASR
jgi:DNA-binding MarR family transcriptional regulator